MYATLTAYTGVAKILIEGAQNRKILWRFLMTIFGNIMAMMSLKWHHNWFFEDWFRHNQLDWNIT